jgi:hypothetical protein
MGEGGESFVKFHLGNTLGNLDSDTLILVCEEGKIFAHGYEFFYHGTSVGAGSLKVGEPATQSG